MSDPTPEAEILPSLSQTFEMLIKEFGLIADERKQTLRHLSEFVKNGIADGETVYLNFICTHNSRRSHIAQLWAYAAAVYYRMQHNIVSFSGGTEATAFNPRAVKAMQDAGFAISKTGDGKNPIYEVKVSSHADPVKAFSKKYDDPANAATNFAAIMTCSHADENCPLIPGASKRIAITYDDPKDFDDTPQEEEKYKERVLQIGREIIYVFAQVVQGKPAL
jgi:arsenate reductase